MNEINKTPPVGMSEWQKIEEVLGYLLATLNRIADNMECLCDRLDKLAACTTPMLDKTDARNVRTLNLRDRSTLYRC